MEVESIGLRIRVAPTPISGSVPRLQVAAEPIDRRIAQVSPDAQRPGLASNLFNGKDDVSMGSKVSP